MKGKGKVVYFGCYKRECDCGKGEHRMVRKQISAQIVERLYGIFADATPYVANFRLHSGEERPTSFFFCGDKSHRTHMATMDFGGICYWRQGMEIPCCLHPSERGLVAGIHVSCMFKIIDENLILASLKYDKLVQRSPIRDLRDLYKIKREQYLRRLQDEFEHNLESIEVETKQAMPEASPQDREMAYYLQAISFMDGVSLPPRLIGTVYNSKRPPSREKARPLYEIDVHPLEGPL